MLSLTILYNIILSLHLNFAILEVEISLHFNLAFSKCCTSIYLAFQIQREFSHMKSIMPNALVSLKFYQIESSWVFNFVTLSYRKNLMHTKSILQYSKILGKWENAQWSVIFKNFNLIISTTGITSKFSQLNSMRRLITTVCEVIISACDSDGCKKAEHAESSTTCDRRARLTNPNAWQKNWKNDKIRVSVGNESGSLWQKSTALPLSYDHYYVFTCWHLLPLPKLSERRHCNHWRHDVTLRVCVSAASVSAAKVMPCIECSL